MAVIEIQAKTMLAHIREPDDLFGLKYNMNLYRGCQHQCIYCDSRSACYEIENFNHDVLVKANALELLEKELPRKRVKGAVGTGSMNDPYMPLEERYGLTRGALVLIARYGFGVHVLTKSDLVLRDIDLLQKISRVGAAVGFSISTTDDDLGKKLEHGAPPPSARFNAMRVLNEQGIRAGTIMMPVLPFLQDTPENIRAVVEQTAAYGGRFIVPWFGMSLRDRQREYYYQKLDLLFPGLRQQYERAFGDRYGCSTRNPKQLANLFYSLCQQYGLDTRIPNNAKNQKAEQLSLL